MTARLPERNENAEYQHRQKGFPGERWRECPGRICGCIFDPYIWKQREKPVSSRRAANTKGEKGMSRLHEYELERLFDAIKDCVLTGMSVERFMQKVRECWIEAKRQDLADDTKTLNEAKP